MDIAALIISTIALVGVLISLSLMLAKNFFSTHQVQMVPVDPMKGLMDALSPDIGQEMGKQYRSIDDPLDEEELEYLEGLKKKNHRT